MKLKLQKRTGIFPAVFLLLSLIFLSAGCARSSEDETFASAAETAAAAYGDNSGVGTAYKSLAYTYDEAAELEDSAEELYTEVSPQEAVPAPGASQERKLIRNVNVSLETEKFEETVQTIKTKITELGGYLESSSEYRGSYQSSGGRSADITARIPSEYTDAFLAESFGSAYITSLSENTQDITLQYSDLETRNRSLETERDRLLELMEEAEDIDSIIALNERLTEVRCELENIQRNLKSYDNQVSYSTVWIYVNEVKYAEPSTEASFWERIRTGFLSSTEELFSTLTDLAVWIVSNSLTLTLLALIIFLVFRLIRKQITRKNKKTGLQEPETKA